MGLWAVVMVLAFNTASAATATEKSVRELLTITGAGEMGKQMMRNMLPGLKQMVPQVPEAFWTEFMNEVDANELIDQVIPIYQRHYSEEDLQAAIKFYRSPAGRRMIEKQSVVMQESMQVGQQWGQDVARRVIEKAQKLGDKPPAQ